LHPPEGDAVLLERCVVREHLKVGRYGQGRVDRLVDAVHELEGDYVRLKADGEV